MGIAQCQDLGRGLARRRRRSPAEDRGDPEQQFARLERLRQIVVGARLQPLDPVAGLVARGQEQDRRIDLIADAAGQAEPVLARHHHVNYQHVEGQALEQTRGVGRVACGGDQIAASGQEAFQ